MRSRYLESAFATGLAFAISTFAAWGGDIPAKKQTKAELYLTALDAVEFLKSEEVLFIDVRSRAEVAFLGLPTRVDVHIPYMVMPLISEYDAEAKGYNLEMNPDFPVEFRAYAAANGVTENTAIAVMCRSGSRSAKAANILFDMGFKNVYSMLDGFEGDTAKDGPYKGKRAVNGWKNADLEWSYKIDASQVYPSDRM